MTDPIGASKRRIYTRRGDLGETALYAGPRVAKDQIRIKVCGDVDELSSVLGVVRAEGLAPQQDGIVQRIQNELIEFGSEVVCLTPVRFDARTIGRDHVQRMEDEIDQIETFLPPLTRFVLPGGCKSAAYLHLARTVCRRAERRFVTLIRKEPEVSRTLLAYLNRLGDLLFVMARNENRLHGKEE